MWRRGLALWAHHAKNKTKNINSCCFFFVVFKDCSWTCKKKTRFFFSPSLSFLFLFVLLLASKVKGSQTEPHYCTFFCTRCKGSPCCFQWREQPHGLLLDFRSNWFFFFFFFGYCYYNHYWGNARTPCWWVTVTRGLHKGGARMAMCVYVCLKEG